MIKKAKKVSDTRLIYSSDNTRILNKLDKKELVRIIDELEDTIELLKAEKKATGFIPYERFRTKLKDKGCL